MAARNARTHHTSYLQQYLRSHANGSCSTVSPKSQRPATVQGSSKTKSSQPGILRESTFTKKTSSQRNPSYLNDGKSDNLPVLPRINASKSKAKMENIPDEILSAIFWKLPIGDLLVASQVCRRWYRVAGDNLLWKRYFLKFVGPTSKEPEDALPVQDLDRCFWKNLCLKRCKVKRDQIYLKKWKQPDSYTGLKQRPELTLGKVGVRFELSFLGPDSCAPTHTLSHDDVFWLTTSASVRWYGLVFPDVAMVRGIKVHACSPLMFYGPAKPAKDGMFQKSLLLSMKVDLKDFMKKEAPIGEDEHVQLFELGKGVLLARYKVDNELAFVMCVLHYHNLVSRCLSGTPDKCWAIPRRCAPQDDIDSHYGLHGYSCLLILRNTRQKLLECKFPDLYTKKDALVGDYARFSPVRKEDKLTHVTCLKDICFPWRTSLFKGIIQNVAVLDMMLLDEGGEPFWTVTTMVSFQTSTAQTDQFEFSPESYRYTNYKDEMGQIEIEIGRLEDGTAYLSRLDILVSLAAINDVFHTSYGNIERKTGASSARKKLASAAKKTT